jgi:hypothetical protein
MVTLSINDFTTGEFSCAFNQNDIPNIFNQDKVKEIITKAFGKLFAEDYFLTGNENKYTDIEPAFSFVAGGKTYFCKGLDYMVKCFVFAELQNELLPINQTDSGAVVTMNEASTRYNRQNAVKYNNRGFNEIEMLEYIINKEYDVKAINDFYAVDLGL